MKKLASWETIKELIKITKEEFFSLQNSKVDKVSGKGLSSNDFSNTYKSKLDGLQGELDKKADKDPDLRKTKILTEEEYNGLSDTDKNKTDTIYFIRK